MLLTREERFPEPEQFSIRRTNSAEHVAFGSGPHRCPGMQAGQYPNGQPDAAGALSIAAEGISTS